MRFLLLLLIGCSDASQVEDMATCTPTPAGFCNPADCPPQLVSTGEPCTRDGLRCEYPFREDLCVEGKWLLCGDAFGQGCQQLQAGSVPVEGSVCCPPDYTTPMRNSCDCIKGLQCSCENYHLHCEACDL